MDYTRSLLVYQDRPAYGLLLKLILAVTPGAMLAGGIYLYLSGNNSDAPILLGEALFVGLIFWAVFPRWYQVYEDHLRIVLGGPFSVKIRFENVKSVAVSGGLTLTANFVTRFTRQAVVIGVKKGFNVAITPRDNDLFVENANSALSLWLREAGTAG